MSLTVRQNKTRLLKKMGLNKSDQEEAFKSRRPANAAGNKMLELIKLYRLAMKAMPGSPKQKEIQKKISALRKELKLNEKLGKNADAGDYIDDFMKSDAPQFKGKSDKKIQKMAIAAKLEADGKPLKSESAALDFMRSKYKDSLITPSSKPKAPSKKELDRRAANRAANQKSGPMAQDPYKSRAGESD